MHDTDWHDILCFVHAKGVEHGIMDERHGRKLLENAELIKENKVLSEKLNDKLGL